MFKKMTALLLAAGLVFGCAGCGQGGQEGQATQGSQSAQNGQQADPGSEGESEKGRYVEKEMALPEGVAPEDIFQLGKKGGELCLYAAEKKEEGIGFACYLYRNGSFEKETPAWLERAVFAEEQMADWASGKIIENVNGKSYLFVVLLEGENLIGHLYMSEDGTELKEITPNDWLEEDPEYHFYMYPEDIAVMEDGSIVAHFYSEDRIYDGGTMESTKKFQCSSRSGEYTQSIFASGDTFYLLINEYNGGGMVFGGIDAYRQNTDKPAETIPCKEDIGTENFLDILSDGTLVLCGKNGIFRQDAESGEWKKVVEGIYTSLSDQNMWCQEIKALDNGNYYALFFSDGKVSLMEYSYDPEVAAAPMTVLTVYSLYENTTVKQAAAMYTKANPDVLVRVETGISYEEMETADVKAVLQSLHAALLAGEGADILVLDGLDADSFIEKGLLADISDVVTPMAADGTILKNIADGFTDGDGKVYRIPLKFSMNLLIGRDIDARKAGTLAGMAEALSAAKQPILGQMTVYDLTAAFAPYMVSDIVKGKELDKEALAQKLEYLKAIAENGGIVEQYANEYGPWSIWNIAAQAGACFYDTNGFLDAMLPVGAANMVKGTYSSFENAYKPIGQIGINSTSENVDAAKDFVRFALSFAVQDGDFYDGFPVNVEALESQTQKDRSNYSMYTSIDLGGGQSAEFEIGALSEEDNQKLLALCKEVNKIAVEDQEIEKAIAEALPAYLKGEMTLEDTVTKIEQSLSMYLAE